jgi:hypothetical protein
LHFFAAEAATEIVAAFTGALPVGSYVVISVGSADEETGQQLASQYKAATAYNHSPQQISEFFAGLKLVGPGLVDACNWEPHLRSAPLTARGGRILAGVVKKVST